MKQLIKCFDFQGTYWTFELCISLKSYDVHVNLLSVDNSTEN